MVYPRHVIDTQGVLFHRDEGSSTYIPVDGAPRLKPQNFGHNEFFAVTIDGKLYDLNSYQVIEFNNPRIIVDRVILGLFNKHDPPRSNNDRTMFVSDERKLYYVHIDDNGSVRLSLLAKNVTNCSSNGCIVAASDDGKLMVVTYLPDIYPYSYNPQVRAFNLKRKVVNIKNGVFITESGFYVNYNLFYYTDEYSCLDFFHYSFEGPIDDILNDHSNEFYLISSGRLFYKEFHSHHDKTLPVPIEEAESAPWVRLSILEGYTIAVTNSLGEVHSINELKLKKLSIDPGLFRVINTKNSRKIYS
jgi:uncharacterized pyridoxamine 5'-phosphate oxidase family protein